MNILSFVTPKRKDKIFMYDAQYIGFNILALVDFMKENNYTDKYKIIIYYHDSEKAISKYGRHHNVICTSNTLCALWNRLTSKYIFCEQIEYVFTSKPVRGQKIISLWHGLGLKNIGYLVADKEYSYPLNNTFSYMTSTSDFTKDILQKCFHYNDRQSIVVGNPRCDMLFKKKDCFTGFNINKNYDKVFLWLPTFRKSSSRNLFDSDCDFPLLDENNINEFNDILKNSNVLMIIKPHPFQNDLPLFMHKYSNILFIKTSDFYEVDFEFYEFVGQVDALISDYSSIFYEFLLLDRPIGFVIDDFDNYNNARGFNVPDPIEMMPGHKIKTIQDLHCFIVDVTNGKDDYRNERKKINQKVNKYTDSLNSKRLLDFIGIQIKENYK